MFTTIQRDFSNYIESKYSSSNLGQLNNDNKHSKIIFRKEKKEKMYWSTQMNEFLKKQ